MYLPNVIIKPILIMVIGLPISMLDVDLGSTLAKVAIASPAVEGVRIEFRSDQELMAHSHPSAEDIAILDKIQECEETCKSECEVCEKAIQVTYECMRSHYFSCIDDCTKAHKENFCANQICNPEIQLNIHWRQHCDESAANAKKECKEHKKKCRAQCEHMHTGSDRAK
jgi:hypothetical protein